MLIRKGLQFHLLGDNIFVFVFMDKGEQDWVFGESCVDVQ